MTHNKFKNHEDASSCAFVPHPSDGISSTGISAKEKPLNRNQSLLIKAEKGQGLVEYLIIVALMGVATIGIVRALSQTVSAKFATVTYVIQGKEKSITPDEVRDTYYKKKDLSTFFNGAASTEK